MKMSEDANRIYTDDKGLNYTKQRTLESLFDLASGAGFCGAVNGNWLATVTNMGKWYEANIHTYQTGTDGRAHGKKGWYRCPIINANVADDCSGFVQACLLAFGVKCSPITTTDMNGEAFMKLMESAGFIHYNGIFDKNNSQPGDILCGKCGSHTEIYAGDGKSWGWGTIHDGKNGHRGMPSGFCDMSKRGGYIHCWRKS